MFGLAAGASEPYKIMECLILTIGKKDTSQLDSIGWWVALLCIVLAVRLAHTTWTQLEGDNSAGARTQQKALCILQPDCSVWQLLFQIAAGPLDSAKEAWRSPSWQGAISFISWLRRRNCPKKLGWQLQRRRRGMLAHRQDARRF